MTDDRHEEPTGQPSMAGAQGGPSSSGAWVTPKREPGSPPSGSASGEDKKQMTPGSSGDKESRNKGFILIAIAGGLLLWFVLTTLYRQRAAKAAPPDAFSRTPANNARAAQLPLFAVNPAKNSSGQGGGQGTSTGTRGTQEDPEIGALHRQAALLQAMSAVRQAHYQYQNLRVNPSATGEQQLSVIFTPAGPSGQGGDAPQPSAPVVRRAQRPFGSEADTYATATETAKSDSGKQSVVRAGTMLDAVLVNKLVTDNYTSPVITMVDRPYYDAAERRLLIPAGTRILGEAQAVKFQTASRLAITFHTFQFPDGRTLYIKPEESALEGLGVFGLADSVNRHTARILFTAGLVGILTGWNASQVQTSTYGQLSGTDQMRLSASESLSNTAEKMLSPFLNAVPTITVNEGHRLKIFITRDLPVNFYEEGPRE